MSETQHRDHARTQPEIVARIESISDEVDPLWFRRRTLLGALDLEHARPFIPGAVIPDWEPVSDLRGVAKDLYLKALGHLLGHRADLASLVPERLGEYAWLIGGDDAFRAMDEAPYTRYGAPKVRAFATGVGLIWPHDPALERLAAGEPCHPKCSRCLS
ncbi:hypothetical protein [Sphaerisporangium aureirubrum]|uniref:Uncharacterized protein n=1 Tax=Sphaerisporangium aureirubrum TaxID=1544736 RepID=A0ABW1NDA1_9ACTN